MKRTAFSALLLFALAATATLAGEPKGIVGVWAYEGEVDTKADGSPAHPSAMSDVEGLLIYTADGFMSVNLMPVGRRWSTETATLPELRETVSNGTAYAGRYEVDPTSHTVTHIASVCMEAPYEGRRLVRSYALDGDKLLLKGTFPSADGEIHFTITWTRVRPEAAAR